MVYDAGWKNCHCLRDPGSNQGNGSSLQGSVIAMVRRRLEDSEEAFRGMHKCSQWEVPVVELVLSSENRGGY